LPKVRAGALLEIFPVSFQHSPHVAAETHVLPGGPNHVAGTKSDPAPSCSVQNTVAGHLAIPRDQHLTEDHYVTRDTDYHQPVMVMDESECQENKEQQDRQ